MMSLDASLLIRMKSNCFLHFFHFIEEESKLLQQQISFDRWNEIFRDVVLTPAIIDMLKQ